MSGKLLVYQRWAGYRSGGIEWSHVWDFHPGYDCDEKMKMYRCTALGQVPGQGPLNVLLNHHLQVSLLNMILQELGLHVGNL